MKVFYKFLFVVQIIILFTTCREVYYPEDVNSNQSIPVIQGRIVENELPSVTLSWALGYKDQITEYISGAQVYVTDDLGNSVDLYETTPGNYNASDEADFKGVQGRTYTLHTVLPDGFEYVSTPAYLQANPFVDSLYAYPDTREYYVYNAEGEPVLENQQGLYIQADLSANAGSPLYYRFNTEVVKEMIYSIDVSTPAARSVYMWEIFTLDNVYSVDYSMTFNDRQVLLEHPVGFLRYFYDATLETETATAPFTVGWVLIFKVYCISGDVFNYYNSIAQQLNSDNKLFAPVPSQIKSNIQCVSDKEKEVIGVFEASSVTTVYRAFAFKDLASHLTEDISSFPENLKSGSRVGFPPDFWIFF